MRGTGRCHGSFGELAQGVVNGQPFLISLPVDLWSEATFYPTSSSEVIGPSNKQKAIKACELLLQKFQIQSGGKLLLTSNIPAGKGMASSTADIIASLRAVADCFQLPITPELISEMAVAIEPTDGLMYGGVCTYNHRRGKLIEHLGLLPNFVVIGIDVGGEIDTISFNKRPIDYSAEERKLMQETYQYVKTGIREHQSALLYKGTTMSAIINDRILPKPFLQELLQIAMKFSGGIVVAHSGTVLGILIHEQQEISAILTEIRTITRLEPFVLPVIE